jgi:hypothetical protein
MKMRTRLKKHLEQEKMIEVLKYLEEEVWNK